MNINEEQKLIKLRKQHLIVKQHLQIVWKKKYGLHLQCLLQIYIFIYNNNS